jgi:ribosomal protein S18 acetylase RimI-like enzyme
MPDDYLDGIRAEDRASMWRRSIEERRGDGLLVAAVDRSVVGFVAFGPCPADAVDGRGDPMGQVHALNVHPDVWRQGIGRQLLRAATVRLAGQGMGRLVLWVALGNDRARSFYESEGWTSDGLERDEDVLGVVVTELRYSRGANDRR